MRLQPLLLASGSFLLALAAPAPRPAIWDDIVDAVNPGTDTDLLDSVLLFDAPAFQPPNDANTWLTTIRVFTHERTPDLGIVTAAFEGFLSTLGVDVGNAISTLEQRVRLFAAIPDSGEEVILDLESSCSEHELAVSETPTSGMLERTVTLGSGCTPAQAITANVRVGSLDTRTFKATLFPSSPTGWGVISDIDDTIKVSNVLDKVLSAKKAFLEQPEPVSGMPELYSSLKTSLADPQFVYLSGSPFQFYPMLHKLVQDAYPPGPMILQNFTFTDPAGIIDLIGGKTQEYKLAQIDGIHAMYSGKKWLAIGDSTQKDPETYGDAVRKFGKEWMGCIWIRRVDEEGADNSEERFAAAFQGVEQGRWRVFKDSKELMEIDVEGGKC